MGIVIPLEEKSSERLLEPLAALVASDMALVNRTILSRASSDVSMIPEVANHLISSGGKRLRPILTLATAGLCGYRGEGHVKLAAAVEFMHTATLLHDDVVDESDLRRGAAAARVLWGNEASVLVGDFLLGQAFKMMVEVGSLPCLDVLSPSAMIAAADDRISSARSDPTSTIILKAWPSRKSPTSTLASLPQSMRAASRPRRSSLSSTTSSCKSVAVCMNSTAAASLIWPSPA